MVVASPLRDWRKVLGGVERGMVDVLVREGPVMERSALEERCAAKGINRFSFSAAVMSSPVIRQFGRSVYGLVGSRIPKKAVRGLARRKPSAVGRVLRGFREADDGSLDLLYRLSKAAISGGVVTVPAVLNRRLRGEYTLRSPDGRTLGTFVTKEGSGWGLGPALRRAEANPGDYLLLRFSADSRDVQLRLGGESLAQAIQSGGPG